MHQVLRKQAGDCQNRPSEQKEMKDNETEKHV